MTISSILTTNPSLRDRLGMYTQNLILSSILIGSGFLFGKCNYEQPTTREILGKQVTIIQDEKTLDEYVSTKDGIVILVNELNGEPIKPWGLRTNGKPNEEPSLYVTGRKPNQLEKEVKDYEVKIK